VATFIQRGDRAGGDEPVAKRTKLPLAPQPLNTNPGYVGMEACVDCHAERVAEFRETRHAFAACPPVTDGGSPKLPSQTMVFSRALPDTEFVVTREGRDVIQNKTEHTSTGDQRDSATIAFAYGSGGIGDEVNFAWKGDELFELVLVWLRPQQSWGVQLFADQYDVASHARHATSRCLECHHTRFQQIAGSQGRYRQDSFLMGVTCERCHGPASEHVALHRAHPAEKQPQAIVTPSKLSREQQLDICGQCHASSVFRRTPLFSFRPGDRLEDHFRLLEPHGVENDHVADQMRYMRESECFLKSDSLTCTTCHSPHRKASADEVGRQACIKCHDVGDCHRREQLPEPVRDDCVSCHMPRYNRVAVKFHGVDEPYQFPMRPRQHRIGKYPAAEQEVLLKWFTGRPDSESQQQAHKLRTDLRRHWIEEADRLQSEQRLIPAIAALREAQQLDPTPETGSRLKDLISIQLRVDTGVPKAIQRSDRGQTREAVAILEDVVRLSPKYAPAQGRLGTFYAMLGDKERAAEHLRAVVKGDPNDAYGENMLGWLRYLDGDGAGAAEFFRRADEIYPFQPDINGRWGLSLLLTKDWSGAEQRFRKVLLIDPTDVSGWHGLAHALRNQGALKEALDSAEEAARLSRNETLDILISLADLRLEAGKVQEAADAARKALEIGAKQNPAMLPALRSRWARLLESPSGRQPAESSLR
jgi:tetratricopeptide (TPR) repeat protein